MKARFSARMFALGMSVLTTAIVFSAFGATSAQAGWFGTFVGSVTFDAVGTPVQDPGTTCGEVLTGCNVHIANMEGAGKWKKFDNGDGLQGDSGVFVFIRYNDCSGGEARLRVRWKKTGADPADKTYMGDNWDGIKEFNVGPNLPRMGVGNGYYRYLLPIFFDDSSGGAHFRFSNVDSAGSCKIHLARFVSDIR